jgi:hypothetical protein
MLHDSTDEDEEIGDPDRGATGQQPVRSIHNSIIK